MRAVLTTALEVLGLAAIAAGFAMISLVLGLIAGGFVLILVGFLLAEPPERKQ